MISESTKKLATERIKKRELWTSFYDVEKSFMHWLNLNAIVLLDINASSPMFDVTGRAASFGYDLQASAAKKVMSKPPRFIRKIISFRNANDFDECIKLHNIVRSRYIAAASFMNEKKISFPQRFPMFNENNVNQINYTTDDAYSAMLLPSNGRFTLFSGFFNDELRLDILYAFKSVGLTSIAVTTDSQCLSMEASIDVLELRRHWGCSVESIIHMRRATGKQYTCRITSDTDVTRVKFGLIVLHPKSRECKFYRSNPRKKRLDSLELSAEEVFLPIYFGRRFFISGLD